MRLLSLSLHGFKSFPERTVLEFHEGVTAIVGPNGSGKSNVTDAIRWVLGEQSVKTLRGDSMQDIIFSGTSTRRSMSFAEVTMHVDNSDRLLKIDFAEIAITRRLYRSGESEYMINGQQVRLKDINALFMDTGLGKDSYSIIGQGKVDEILSTKSEDRRRVFEEAAGIQKFKTRKVEAQRKLEHTETNLTRVNDILVELEGQIEPLRKQSETAKTYLNLHNQMRTKDITLLRHQIVSWQKRQDALNEDLALTQADLLDSRKHQETLDVKQLESREALARIDENLENLRTERNQLNALESAAKSEETRLLERQEQLQRRLGEQGESAEQIRFHLDQLKSDIDARKETIARIETNLAAAEERFSTLREQLHAYQADVRAGESHLHDLRTKEQQQIAESIRLQGMKSRQESEADLLLAQAADIELEENDLQSQMKELKLRLDACRDSLEALKRSDATLAEESSKLSEQITSQRKALQEVETNHARIAQEIRNKTYRLDTLRDLERNMEGYGEAVRNILRRVEGDSQLRGSVRGALGSLLKVDQSYELAIEIALGAAVQNIVVDSTKTAGTIIEILKRERLGRATFLPIDTIRSRTLNNNELRELDTLKRQGYIGIASDLVDYPAEIDSIIKNLLGRIVIVNNLDNAIVIARKFGQSFRIVTLEGDVMNPGGSMTGGYNKRKSSGLLGRQRDITTLETELNDLYKEQKSAEIKNREAETVLRDLIREQEKLQSKGMEMAQLKSREEARLSALEEQEHNLINRLILKRKQAEELSARQLKTVEGSAEIDRLMDELSSERLTLKDALLEAEEAVSQSGRLQSEARDALAEADMERTRIEESQRSANELLSHINREYQSREREAEDQATQRERAQEELNSLSEQIENMRLNVSDAGQAITEQDVKIDIKTKARQMQEEAINRLYSEIRQQGETTLALETQEVRLEERAEKLTADLDKARSRLWEDYELTLMMLEQQDNQRQVDQQHDEANESDSENDESGNVKSGDAKATENIVIDEDELSKEISKLRNKIRSLGSVNVDAIEDYEKISERYEFLSAQRDDIEAAKAQLNEVIDELMKAMRDQFQTNFDLIRSYFQETFQELFGGGEADISLEEGQDILESSIEIKASPPGKKLQNMLLLSGGERSLTAIALLFAILKLRPTPFCVLDEIEAALDDVNTLRFTDYIRSYKERSQFIMVTHRKGTMESADMIYGVTMQEKGVSKVLSMVLSDS